MLQYKGIDFYEHCGRCAARRTNMDALASEVARGQQTTLVSHISAINATRASLPCMLVNTHIMYFVLLA